MNKPKYLNISGTPVKPLLDQPCNGCGVCCIAEQCLVSVELFGNAQLCPALEWEDNRFWCGLMRNPTQYGAELPDLEQLKSGLSSKYYQTLIGANRGCDSSDE